MGVGHAADLFAGHGVAADELHALGHEGLGGVHHAGFYAAGVGYQAPGGQ